MAKQPEAAQAAAETVAAPEAAVAAAAETVALIAVQQIDHDGTAYAEGERLVVLPAQAEALIAAGAATPADPPAP